VVGVLLGVILVLLAELGHLEWTKFFGAVLISLGGTGLGIWAGLEKPQWANRLPAPSRGMLIGSTVTVLLTLPLVLALFSALGGLGRGAGGLLGGALCLLVGALTVMSLVVCLRALARATHSSLPGEDGPPSLGQTT
jgi:hypothetical protein